MRKTKTCRACGATKDIRSFNLNKTIKDGRRGECRKCQRARARAYINRPEFVRKRREYYRKTKHVVIGQNRERLYGVTIEKYNEMRIAQHFKCAICGAHESEKTSTFAVDHCHKTNRVRGLLCRSCNTGLGFFRDDPQALKNAIQYLTKR